MLHLAAVLAMWPALEDVARHQGSWSVVRFEREGVATPAEVLGSIGREVEGDHVAWSRDGRRFAGTRFVIRAEMSTRQIDLLPDGGPDRGTTVLGIYRFDEDGTLTICVADAGQPRPTEFASPPGSKRNLQVFRPIRSPTHDAPP